MKIKMILSLIIGLLSFACTKQPPVVNSSISIRLTDAPAGYDEIWIDISSIDILYSNDKVNSNWMTFKTYNNGLFNLLNYKNGKDTLLASSDIVDGNISQIRLVLNDNNSVVILGHTYNLVTPSALTSGIKVIFQDKIEFGSKVQIILDFDAENSIVNTGSGKYQLKPVIRAYTKETTGSLKGIVNPKESSPSVSIKSGSVDLSTTADSNGYFYIGGIPEGIYTVNFTPVRPFINKSIDISIMVGQCTDSGETLIGQQ
jgi:hypothetical protein